MKCIDDEIPFEIPQSWCWARMSSVLDVRDGTHDTPSYVSSGYPLITGKDFYNGYFDLSKTQYISTPDYEIINQRSKVDVGDILFSMIGGNIGSQILITEDNYFEMAIKNVALFKHYAKGMINELYLSYFLQSRVVDFKSIASGGAQSFVSLKQLRNYLIPIPSYHEQICIVSKINGIMQIVEKYEKSQDALDKLNAEIFDKLKKSVLQEAIQGKLVPQDTNDEPASILLERIKEEKAKLFKEGKLKKKDLVDSVIFKGDDNKYYEKVGSEINCIDDEIPFEIPSNWQWVRLGKVTIVNPRNTISDEMSVGFIPMTNISPGYGNSIECEQRYWKDVKSGFTHIAEGDVAFAKITPCFQNRKSFIAANLPNGFAAGTTELNALRPYDNTIDTRYLLWFLKSEYFISEAKFKGTAGQQRVVTDYVLNRLFPLPPVKEQIRISNRLEFVIASITRR